MKECICFTRRCKPECSPDIFNLHEVFLQRVNYDWYSSKQTQLKKPAATLSLRTDEIIRTSSCVYYQEIQGKEKLKTDTASVRATVTEPLRLNTNESVPLSLFQAGNLTLWHSCPEVFLQWVNTCNAVPRYV